jgi:hypothetical protein
VLFNVPVQSVPINTDIMSSNLHQGEVYNIMWYSLSVTCDRVGFFLRFPLPIKLTATKVESVVSTANVPGRLHTISLNEEYRCLTLHEKLNRNFNKFLNFFFYFVVEDHYVIQFVSDLRQSRFFSPVSSTNKTDRHESWKWRWTTPSKQEVNCSIISLWKSSTTKIFYYVRFYITRLILIDILTWRPCFAL